MMLTMKMSVMAALSSHLLHLPACSAFSPDEGSACYCQDSLWRLPSPSPSAALLTAFLSLDSLLCLFYFYCPSSPESSSSLS